MFIGVITNAVILCTSLIGFLYGVFFILIHQRPLYLKMVVLAMACMLVSRGYILLQYLVKGEEPAVFHVGMLGLMGCFLFLFSANYGMIDRLADDGSMQFMRYRIVCWLAPLIIVGGFIGFCLQKFSNPGSKLITYLAVILIIALSSRYHFKHLIFPDVEYGVVRAIRGYNAVALLLCISTMVMIIADINGYTGVYLGAGFTISLLCLILIPILKKEATKWTKI
ncbi:MAG: hypothetical protein K6G65_10585 [Lachnospiraceae bacterium]|nr:hypothetical protein [Lachnospiraceae bacterium]